MSLGEKALQAAFGEPTEKQQKFYTSNTRYVGYGGARGGGKSHGVRGKATFLAWEFPGIKILIVRQTIPDLRRNYVRPLLALYALLPSMLQPRYNSDEKVFTFPNGSTIELGYCDSDADLSHYVGNEWDVIFIDEATQVSEYQYGGLNSCVRGVNRFPKRTYVTCNPGGQGHGNIKRLFIDKEYKRGERASDYTFIQAYVWDNLPLLMADGGFVTALKDELKKRKTKTVTEEIVKECMYFSDYVRTLDNLSEQQREAWLFGRWDIFAGQFFTNFDPGVHVVEPKPILSHWHKSIALDYGMDCFAVLWFAVDEKGKVYCYRNKEWKDLTIPAAADVLKQEFAAHREEIIYQHIAPPDMWNRRQDTGISMAETFARNGIPLIKAGNDRVHGWAQVNKYINYKRKPESTEFIVSPQMVFFDTCEKLVRYIPLLQSNPKKLGDIMLEPHEQTHSPDALRYWCSRRQMTPEIEFDAPPDPFGLNKPVDEGVCDTYLVGGFDVY